MRLTSFLIFPLVLFISMSCFAQRSGIDAIPKNGNMLSDFVPKGYSILLTRSGDLNKDSTDDVVLVLKDDRESENDTENEVVKNKRLLIILFKNKDGYVLAAKSEDLVVCKTCGFELSDLNDNTLDIKHGVFILHLRGGSTHPWYYTRRFRYQKENFYLIGLTNISYSQWMNVAPCDETPRDYQSCDINFITRDRVIKKTANDCKTTTTKDKIALKPLMRLKDINLNNYNEDDEIR